MKQKLMIAFCCLCILIAFAIFITSSISTVSTTKETSTSVVVKRIQAKRAKERIKKNCNCCSKKVLLNRTSKTTQ